jgi:hypothetical protein
LNSLRLTSLHKGSDYKNKNDHELSFHSSMLKLG